MCCTRPPHVSVATIFEISRYMYIFVMYYSLGRCSLRVFVNLRTSQTSDSSGLQINNQLIDSQCDTVFKKVHKYQCSSVVVKDARSSRRSP
ncbi:hypothetical protein T265_10518 [Opisthorchis viverrini]|uniref:Uncharacterized protein n=1 Tax=Opisthorchis viverrini TaxID=6198 RepID=A0A074Z255_OPIVI|nr:hypothetical protein T265_10518 [Opisthorchis viverrini]KER21073.1 hypothetical protein T265_10518 [Opisthorchis viverrini]